MIQVELSAVEIPIEPGNTAQLTVTVLNDSRQDDHVSLEIEGLDVEWYALPVPTLNIPAGAQQSARVLLKITRSSESHAGTYPFLVRARSLETGEAGVQQATLVIKPFSALQVEINPKRVNATFIHHANVIDVAVANLGNHEETLDLYASDPEDACGYEFESDRITVKPGHSETVPLLIEPVTRPVFGAGRLYGFTVTARSVQDSYVTGSAHGQLERRALLSTLTAAVLMLAILGAIAWAAFRPRPPMINSFTATPMQVVAGQPVTLAWDVSNAGPGSHISPGNIPIKSTVDSIAVKPAVSTNYSIIVRNSLGEIHRDVAVVVTPAPPAPRPRILSFTSSARRIHQGDTITLSWKVDGLNTIVLNPLGVARDPSLYKSQEIKPEQTTTYILTGNGPGGDANPKSLTVEVVPPNVSIAQITAFRAKPAAIQPGERSTLAWSVDSAATVEIDNGVGGSLPAHGRFEVSPQQTTVYTLRATDNKGNVTTHSVTVTVLPPPPPPVAPNPNIDNTTPGGPEGGPAPSILSPGH